jgi:hypothetical protein
LHHTVLHAAGEFARDDDRDGFCELHVNTLEGFWSLTELALAASGNLARAVVVVPGFLRVRA